MKKELLLKLEPEELDEYAKTLGIDAAKAKGAKAKVELIERRRERVAEISALGITVTVPVRRMHDKRITDRLNGRRLSDSQLEKLMRDLLGDEQMDAVIEHVTEEDGTVDVDALGLIIAKIVRSDDLKNF